MSSRTRECARTRRARRTNRCTRSRWSKAGTHQGYWQPPTNSRHLTSSSRFLSSAVVNDRLPPLATPAEVAEYLRTTTAALAQDRYKGTAPRFIKRGRRVLYRWSDV